MTRGLLNFLKKHFYILTTWNKFSPSVQIQQRSLFLYYKTQLKNGEHINLNDTGFSVFSQHEEDGLLLFIFAALGMEFKTFVDIGANDGVNSNCANFCVNFGWHGLFVDSDKTAIERGKHFYKKYPDPWTHKPIFVCAKVNMENINDIISTNGFTGEIDLLSIDIDGNDYWIWHAISVISPKVVIIEAMVEYGLHNVVVPYDADYSHVTRDVLYSGASPFAINELAVRKGYRLVGTNNYGHNMIFVKRGLAEEQLPEVSVSSTLKHPFTKKSLSEFEKVKDRLFVKG